MLNFKSKIIQVLFAIITYIAYNKSNQIFADIIQTNGIKKKER